MKLNLENKRALVTGSSSGLGKAIVKLLAAEGAKVIVHGRSEERTRAVANEIIVTGGIAEIALGDLSTEEGAQAVADQVLAHGPVDILINNAGGYAHTTWKEATADVWKNTYETNVLSGVRMIRHLVPGMKTLKWGRVITIGGGLAIQPTASLPDYSATLAARHNLAVSLARQLKGTGITSNVVAPGAILIPSVQELVTKLAPSHGWGETWDEIEKKSVEALVPNDIGRYGQPEEIAGAVAYLCSSYADYITGSVIRVDGGTVRCL
ncbi:SDR family NAD(P)-dependent oxidoreductase [Mucilaginibacter sp. Mucisp86]|uniref:SDR family NAD(P)-dependent oxidoreductase n=1 Tax=Mucilaginibacter sp. Mucisp86 TaxID=3243060 RepID=UPI0039B6D1DD